MPEQISDDNFENKVLKSKKPVVVDFWAEWCGPCRVLGPRFAELSEEMDELEFLKLDVDANQESAAKYQVRSIPTLLVFKDGEVAARIIGALPKDALKEKLQQAIA